MLQDAASHATVVTHVSGERFAIQIRSHQIMVDQTLAGGGSDSAPTPIELLGASLGSCVAYYVRHFYRARGLESEGLTVEVVQTAATNPGRIQDFAVTVNLPSPIPAKYAKLLDRVIENCPARNTLKIGAGISVKFEAPVPERVGA